MKTLEWKKVFYRHLLKDRASPAQYVKRRYEVKKGNKIDLVSHMDKLSKKEEKTDV